MALACDHRAPFVNLVAEFGKSPADITRFKLLTADAARKVARDRGCRLAMFMDGAFGAPVLEALGADDAWIGRPVEVTGSRPLEFEAGPDLAAELRHWHPAHIAKCLVWRHPDDSADVETAQVAQLLLLQAAAQAAEIEWILEAIPPLDLMRDDETLVRGVEGLYAAGLRPDYWKLPAFGAETGWKRLDRVIKDADPACRGVLTLGLNLPLDDLLTGLSQAATQPLSAGFAIGRSIFGGPARDWFAGRIDDADAVSSMAIAFAKAVDAYLAGRARLLDLGGPAKGM
jgi:5-dehydro-2-deoxygluconokinase